MAANATENAENAVETRAVAKYIRISPFKVRQVMDAIRGQDVEAALNTLRFTPKKAAGVIYKVVNSAAANAEKNLHIDRGRLYIATAFADEGPTLKRIRPRAHGRAARIRKRTSHITVVVREKEV
ncbi:MAG: 50S ribosomal protein L22 [Candidatus Aquicultorales bacterium]